MDTSVIIPMAVSFIAFAFLVGMFYGERLERSAGKEDRKRVMQIAEDASARGELEFASDLRRAVSNEEERLAWQRAKTAPSSASQVPEN